jgi:hypothetical protein
MFIRQQPMNVKIIAANFHHSHELNAGKMLPQLNGRKTKTGTLTTHQSKKLYVQATMKNEALLGA